MLRVIGLIVTIALGDSLNPSTIAPALYVASGDRPRLGTLEFTISVLLVHFAGGLLLLLGSGQLLLSLLNQIGHATRNALEVIAGIAMLVAAAGFWHKRDDLARKDLPGPPPKRKSTSCSTPRSSPSSCRQHFPTSRRSPRCSDQGEARPARSSSWASTTCASSCR